MVAHRINDIADRVVSSGRAFGRVDLRIAPDAATALSVKIHQPRLCEGETDGNAMLMSQWCWARYEAVLSRACERRGATIADEAAAAAAPKRNEKLGVKLTGVVTKSYGLESAEGNWFTDPMLATQPAHVALTNGGGLRADLGVCPHLRRVLRGDAIRQPLRTRRRQGAHIRRLI